MAADISRLLTLLRIQDSVGEKAIGVRTVHKFIRDWLVSLDLLGEERDFIDCYSDYKRELLEYLTTGALQDADIQSLKRDHSGDLSWDYILIDECQDWPEDERDIIYKIYGHNCCILADGVDQLVRSSESTDWRAPIDITESQIVPLRKSLRLKSGLCEVVSELADILHVPNWDLQPEPDIYGGKVIVLAGVPYTQDIHDGISKSNTDAGNRFIDMLFCVPPSYVARNEDGERASTLATTLAEWGYDVWDGASYSIRSSYPTSTNQHRIVQYDSCRGLEGWTVVCLSLDNFFDYKKTTYEPGGDTDLFTDHDDQAISFANRWVMIPLTRAIDTLVIHIDDESHPVGTALRSAAKKYPDLIEWRT